MKIIAFPRAEQGTGASRRLRKAGMTPGIIYGGTSAPVNIKLDHNALFHALRREAFHSSILDIEIEGKTEKVLLRDYQMHAYKPVVLHADFQRVSANQQINVKVPLHFLNGDTSPAVKLSNGVIHQAATDVEITCLPANLPEYIEVDLANMDVGQTIHVSDLKLPKGVTVNADPGMSLASAVTASVAPSATEDTTAGSQPAAASEEPKEKK